MSEQSTTTTSTDLDAFGYGRLISDLLARVSLPVLTWQRGKVTAVDTAAGLIDVTMAGAAVKVPYLASWVPVVGDTAEMLVYEPQGIIAIGKQAKSTGSVVPPSPPAPVTVASTGSGTYNVNTDTWQTGVVVMDGGVSQGAYFYSRTALAAITLPLGRFEISLQSTTNSLPVAVMHGNASATGEFTELTQEYGTTALSANVATWVSLPLSWGEALVEAAQNVAPGGPFGVGLSSETFPVTNTATFVGSGALRFTPLS